MPGKAGFPHPEVEVRCVHARDVHPILPGYCVQDGVQTVDVPFPYTRISEGPRDVRTAQRLVESHILPVFPFQFFIVLCLGRFVPEQPTIRHQGHLDNGKQRQGRTVKFLGRFILTLCWHQPMCTLYVNINLYIQYASIKSSRFTCVERPFNEPFRSVPFPFLYHSNFTQYLFHSVPFSTQIDQPF